MPGAAVIRPDVLVLGAGGTLGEAWMTGLLAGIEKSTGLDLRQTETFLGTSAGAIVAARLAAGRRPRGPSGRRPAIAVPTREPPPTGSGRLERLATRLLAPTSSAAIRLERIPGGAARTGVLALLPEGTNSLAAIERSVTRLAAHFDGRLRIACVERRSGRRVVFGAPGSPTASVGQAVAASCAIPGYYRPMRIGGRDYVDGAAWSLTNLDAAAAGQGTEVLCLNPMAGVPVSAASPLGLLRAALRSRQVLELAAVRHRGARVRMIGPAPPAARLMAPDLMDAANRQAVLRAGYAQGLNLAPASSSAA